MPVTTNTYPIHTTHISQKLFFCEAGTLVWVNSLSFTFSIFSSLCNGYAYDFYWKRNKERGLLNKDGSCKFSRNSAETQLCDSLASLVSDNDCVFSKYSYDCFAHTSLEFELKRRHIKTVIVVGTVVNWCVDSTVRSAYHKDYNVVVLSDCVSGYEHAGATGDKWVDMELDLFAEGFAEVMSSDAAISELNKISIINETKKSSSF